MMQQWDEIASAFSSLLVCLESHHCIVVFVPAIAHSFLDACTSFLSSFCLSVYLSNSMSCLLASSVASKASNSDAFTSTNKPTQLNSTQTARPLQYHIYRRLFALLTANSNLYPQITKLCVRL